MTTTDWERRKTAALEYSTFRPYLVAADYVPTAGSKQQFPPAGAFGVEHIAWGEEVTLAEVLTAAADSVTQGWCFAGGFLYLTPAPTDTTPITVIWREQHPPDELTQTFPTIPPEDQLILDWLVEAAIAEEEQAAVEAGLKSYTIAGTTVTWAQEGGGGPSGLSRGKALRERALARLREPLGIWG